MTESQFAACGGNQPLPDPRDMDPDELFALLGLSDMDDRERLEFIQSLNAWSATTYPAPDRWWIYALLQANLWKRTIANHVDQLITQALGK